MTGKSTTTIGPGSLAIPSWRFTAGVFLHFAVPAYLLFIVVTCLVAANGGAGITALLEPVPRASAWFIGAYAVLATASVAAAALFDPVAHWRHRRRVARDPRSAAIASQQRLARAITDGRRALDAPSRDFLEALRRPGWDHADPRFQALSNDLAEVVRTSCAALASAPPERRPELRALATGALEQIDAALNELAEERARLDEGDARVISRYVRLRLTQSDSAGEGL